MFNPLRGADAVATTTTTARAAVQPGCHSFFYFCRHCKPIAIVVILLLAATLRIYAFSGYKVMSVLILLVVV